MSETPKVRTSPLTQRISFFITIAVVVLLLLGYLVGYMALPSAIKSAYPGGNCESVLNLEGTYTSLYPSMMVNKSVANTVRECAVYTLAVNNEEKKTWRDSYDAFNVYSETYPEGLFAIEAHEHSAISLTGLAKEEIDQKKYVEAVENLNLILVDYKDTKAAIEADNLIPEVYTAWGADLRATGDFVGAERIFNDFKTRADSNQKKEQAKSAQYELAQTYLAWGLSLQSQKQFDDAKANFDLAVSFNPGLAEQIQASQTELYSEWGDYLVEQRDFAGAMEQYETAAALSENGDPTSASDIIANGYIQWASGSITEEDYLGGLVLLDFAQASTVTDSTKTLVDNARSDLYLAFSKSNAEQAQKAIMDAVRIVCEHHIQPRLPIFGLDNDSILVDIYGIEGTLLPENVAATTPASLHYVVCIEENSRVGGSTIHNIYATAAGFKPYLFERLQYTWTVTLRKTDTGEETATTIIEGGDPPQLPTIYWDIYVAARSGSTQYFGPKPDFAELVNWLSSVIK
jgi:tetratricopeptide (TPR) repeat protein